MVSRSRKSPRSPLRQRGAEGGFGSKGGRGGVWSGGGANRTALRVREHGTTERESEPCRGWLWAPVILSALGVLVSGYLSVKRLTGGNLACSRWAECDVVNNSVYAKIYGVPVAFIGLAGYLVLLALALAALQASGLTQRKLLTASFVLALGGFAFSGYLTYIEFFVLKAICNWCLASATLITLLGVVGGLNFVWMGGGSAEKSPASA